MEKKISHVLEEKPILVGVTIRNIDDSYFASRDFSLRRIIPVLEEIKRSTEAPICISGVGFSIFPFETLEFCDVPYGLCGDGEDGLVKLIMALNDNIELESVPGLVWMDDGRYRKNVTLPVPLEEMDLATRSLIDNGSYLENGGQVGFETKRGCSLNCVYCPEPHIRCKEVRVRNTLNVVEELTNLFNHGINVFNTCDSEFNCPYSHAVLVSKAIIEAGLGSKIR